MRKGIRGPAGSWVVACLVVVASLALVGAAAGQDLSMVEGSVVTEDGEGLGGALVRVLGTERWITTAADGSFQVNVPPGSWVVEATLLGRRSARVAVDVSAGESVDLEFVLALRPLDVGGITVSVLRPDLQPQEEMEERQVREANPSDAGDVLRALPGVEAVRRGPLGLDPSVRGLRETEVGMYLDGSRQFPAGPGRMDSPLTHLDPSAVASIEVVKGPYALTWGAGNLAAIRVTTSPLATATTAPSGRVDLGFDSNRNSYETAGRLQGKSGAVSYLFSGALRSGSDYEAGGGTAVEGDFDSWETRGRIGIDLTERARLQFSLGYQEQGPIDYPGRLLTADFFESLNLAAHFDLEGSRSQLTAMVYANHVDHGMDNTGKPTAQPMPGRMPPFALDVTVESEAAVSGGRVSYERTLNPATTLELGTDLYAVVRDATRSIRRQDSGMEMFVDRMWPDATIWDAGFFGRANRGLGQGNLSTTLRFDVVGADAKDPSEFFLANRPSGAHLDQSELNLSGAVTYGFPVNRNWTLSVGLGSAVRTADATERYSDRIPASKAQMSAEFMGNPGLDPERSTQADLWLEGAYSRVSLQLNAFARKVHDFITVEATDLPKRLPLSPPTVFRYVNGEATFAGFEAGAVVGLNELLTLEGSAAYLWGHDDFLDEAALGVSPLRVSSALRFEDRDGRFFGEARVRLVGDQNRVSGTRGELASEGYAVADLRGGFGLVEGVTLRVGIDNVFDEFYVDHLNAKNPFTGAPVPEIGRVLFVDLGWAF